MRGEEGEEKGGESGKGTGTASGPACLLFDSDLCGGSAGRAC